MKNAAPVSVIVFALAACGGAEEPKAPTSTGPSSVDTTGRVNDSMVRTESPPPVQAATPAATEVTTPAPSTPVAEPTPAPAPAALNDGQIINVLQIANDGEIEQAKLAQKNAKDARVKKLAVMMLRAHQAANAKAKEVAKKGNLITAPSEESSKVAATAQQLTSGMSSSTGSDFDRAYVDAQVTEHLAVLELIDGKFMADAKNADTKKLLEKLRPEIETHLKHVQEVQKALAK